MANSAYLLNSTTLTSDTAQLQRLREGQGHADGIVAEGSARLPVPWFLCFRAADLRPVPWGSIELRLPCTSVERAVSNLEASLPILEAVAGDAALARPYWSLACAGVRALPLPYLVLGPSEIFDMGSESDARALAEQIAGAIAGDLSAVPHLKALAEYDDAAPAYPLDILYNVGEGIDRYSPRTWNASVLDFGFVTAKYVQWNCSPGTAQPEMVAPPQSAYGELRDVAERVTGWVREAMSSTGSALAPCGRLALVPGATEALVLRIYARSDADASQLERDAGLASRLDILARERLQPWCAKNGFGWAGVAYSSPAWART